MNSDHDTRVDSVEQRRAWIARRIQDRAVMAGGLDRLVHAPLGPLGARVRLAFTGIKRVLRRSKGAAAEHNGSGRSGGARR